MNYIHIFIFVFLYSFSQLVSSAQANPENAAVLVYGWSHKDGCPKMLMSYEPLKAAWTLPGGRKTPTQSIQQAAAHELYEETAAYPYFTPSQTLPLIQKADRSHWFFFRV